MNICILRLMNMVTWSIRIFDTIFSSITLFSDTIHAYTKVTRKNKRTHTIELRKSQLYATSLPDTAFQPTAPNRTQ